MGWMRLVAIAASIMLSHVVAVAQPEKVISESALTEQALVEALATPPEAPASEPQARSRSFRPVQVANTAAARDKGRASVLITFVVDSAELTPAARDALQVVAKAMKSDRLSANAFTIEGHADPRGSDTHNTRLSMARASAVVDHLVSVHGIARERLAAVGLGSSQLLDAANPTAAENRRVTFVSR